ncbi:hypothetical protein [Frigidibacter sp. MR17.24]
MLRLLLNLLRRPAPSALIARRAERVANRDREAASRFIDIHETLRRGRK